MIFFSKKTPENPKLKEWFSWRYTAVTDHQIRDLTNKLADEIVMRARFLTCLSLDKPPVRDEKGVRLEAGTKISVYTLRSDKDQKFLPLFTDREELEKWAVAGQDGVTRVIVGFDEAVRLLHTYHLFGFVINPFSDNYAQTIRTADAWEKAKLAILKMAAKKKSEAESDEKQ